MASSSSTVRLSSTQNAQREQARSARRGLGDPGRLEIEKRVALAGLGQLLEAGQYLCP